MDLFFVFLTHLWIFTYFECHSRFHSILLWYWFMLCWNDHEWSLQDVEDFPAMGPQTSPIIAIADPISKFFGIWIFWMMQHQLRCCCNIFWFIRVCSKFFHNLWLVFFPLKGGPSQLWLRVPLPSVRRQCFGAKWDLSEYYEENPTGWGSWGLWSRTRKPSMP